MLASTPHFAVREFRAVAKTRAAAYENQLHVHCTCAAAHNLSKTLPEATNYSCAFLAINAIDMLSLIAMQRLAHHELGNHN